MCHATSTDAMVQTQQGKNGTKEPVQTWSTRVPPKRLHTGIGAVVLSFLLLTCVAAPRLLPHAFLLFAMTGLPWRIIDFASRNYEFFLVDWCYFANLATILFLVFEPQPTAHGHQTGLWRGLEAAVYVMVEGPLAAALVAWRCSWVLGWADYTISVLIHLLPGLAMAAHRHAWTPTLAPTAHLPFPEHGTAATASPAPATASSFLDAVRFGTQEGSQGLMHSLCHWANQPQHLQLDSSLATQRRITYEWDHGTQDLTQRLCRGFGYVSGAGPLSGVTAGGQVERLCACEAWGGWMRAWATRGEHMEPCCWHGWALWVLLFPVASYLLWQLAYWIIVQVLFQPIIRSRRLDTSYKSLSRRSKKAGGGAVSSWVLQGSLTRRLTAFGLVQLGFTIGTMVLGIVSYEFAYAAIAWQVFKFGLPLYMGLRDTAKAYRYAKSLKKLE